MGCPVAWMERSAIQDFGGGAFRGASEGMVASRPEPGIAGGKSGPQLGLQAQTGIAAGMRYAPSQ
jgi:hypothetical protein